MDKPKITPKDFFLWFGAMVFLYISVFSLIALIFSYLDYVYPDPLRYYGGDPYSQGISTYMAMLIVLCPLFVVLMRIIHLSIENDSSRREIWIRRWALYLTLFIAGITVAGDLVTLVTYFFNGDVTLRFALKVLVILLVAVIGFMHFLADLRNYWQRNGAKARVVGYAVLALVVIAIGAGFFIIGTPWQARQYRYDEQRVSDLQNIQSEVVYYYRQKGKLPANFSDLRDPIANTIIPNDPATGAPYEYRTLNALSFSLCAEFSAPTQPGAALAYSYPTRPAALGDKTDLQADSWGHGAGGYVCFERTIDPELYPQLKKLMP